MTKLISRRNKASIGKRTALKLCINKLLCDVHSFKFKTGNRNIVYNHTNVENHGKASSPFISDVSDVVGITYTISVPVDTIHLTSKRQTIIIF